MLKNLIEVRTQSLAGLFNPLQEQPPAIAGKACIEAAAALKKTGISYGRTSQRLGCMESMAQETFPSRTNKAL